MSEIEFFFDVGSAYSYLAATQMAGVAGRTGKPVRWRPFLLGAVFKATGNEMPARVPAKARWMMQDMALWARHYNIPARVPSRFPLNTLRTQRALAAIEHAEPARLAEVALAMFRAFWVEDRDVSTDAVIGEIAGAAIVPAIDAQQTKDHLRATTDEAVKRGAFGAPAMFVGDALFWGNDRIPLLEEYVRTQA